MAHQAAQFCQGALNGCCRQLLGAATPQVHEPHLAGMQPLQGANRHHLVVQRQLQMQGLAEHGGAPGLMQQLHRLVLQALAEGADQVGGRRLQNFQQRETVIIIQAQHGQLTQRLVELLACIGCIHDRQVIHPGLHVGAAVAHLGKAGQLLFGQD